VSLLYDLETAQTLGHCRKTCAARRRLPFCSQWGGVDANARFGKNEDVLQLLPQETWATATPKDQITGGFETRLIMVYHGLSWDLPGCGSSVSARSNSGQLFDWKIDWKLCQEMQRSHVQVRAWLWGASFCLDLSHVASGGWSPSSDGAGVQGSTMASLWLHYWLDFWGVAM